MKGNDWQHVNIVYKPHRTPQKIGRRVNPNPTQKWCQLCQIIVHHTLIEHFRHEGECFAACKQSAQAPSRATKIQPGGKNPKPTQQWCQLPQIIVQHTLKQ